MTPCRWCGEITTNPGGLCSRTCWEEYYGESVADLDDRRPERDDEDDEYEEGDEEYG